mgnify:FL=1|jgi:hypothetical protein
MPLELKIIILTCLFMGLLMWVNDKREEYKEIKRRLNIK